MNIVIKVIVVGMNLYRVVECGLILLREKCRVFKIEVGIMGLFVL